MDLNPSHFYPPVSGPKRPRLDPSRKNILAAFNDALPDRFWKLRWKRAVLTDSIYQKIPLKGMSFEGYAKTLMEVESERKSLERKYDSNTCKSKGMVLKRLIF
jgi:hypothetical protein